MYLQRFVDYNYIWFLSKNLCFIFLSLIVHFFLSLVWILEKLNTCFKVNWKCEHLRCLICGVTSVCIDFWTQSYQIFRWFVENLKNAQTKLLAWLAAKQWAGWNKIWPKRKAVLKKKYNTRLFTIFPQFLATFQIFSVYANCWADFKHFSRIQKAVRRLSV